MHCQTQSDRDLLRRCAFFLSKLEVYRHYWHSTSAYYIPGMRPSLTSGHSKHLWHSWHCSDWHINPLFQPALVPTRRATRPSGSLMS